MTSPKVEKEIKRICYIMDPLSPTERRFPKHSEVKARIKGKVRTCRVLEVKRGMVHVECYLAKQGSVRSPRVTRELHPDQVRVQDDCEESHGD